MANAAAVNERDFDVTVLKSPVPVLVDFWATWCAPCRMVAPVLEEIATEYDGRLKVVKIDVDENQEVSMRYDVRSIPTLILFKNGEMAERLIGAFPKQTILAKIQKHL